VATLFFHLATAQADTFTAVQVASQATYDNGLDRFYPDSTLTVTVETGSTEAVITFPDSLGHLRSAPWPPVVALLSHRSYAASNGKCDPSNYDSAPGRCIGNLRPRLIGNGRAEIRIPRAWFVSQASIPWERYKRFEACKASGGRQDHKGNPCPNPTDAGPYVMMTLGIQVGGQGKTYPDEFVLLTDTPATRRWADAFPDPDWRPDPSHLGELERVYAWLALLFPDDPGPEDPAPGRLSVFPHVLAGQVRRTEAQTEITITNAHPSTACNIRLAFSRGTDPSPYSVAFNGQHEAGNQTTAAIPPGSARRFVLTAPDAGGLAIGSLYATEAADCPADALTLEGRFLLHSQATGEIIEALTLTPQLSRDWLATGQCRTLSGVFGPGHNIGLAWTPATPHQAPPQGTRLQVRAFDWDGNPAEALETLPVTGQQTALTPWTLDEPRLIKLCLGVPATAGPATFSFRLALLPIAATVAGNTVQYSTRTLIGP
jgi:hypothetical protein